MPGCSDELNQLRAAMAWKKDPRQWRECSWDDRARMMAVVALDALLAARREEWREERSKDKGKGRGGAGDFARMKQLKGLD
jgi:hypothetical protein